MFTIKEKGSSFSFLISKHLPVVFARPVKEELNEGFSKGRREEGIEYWVDTGIGISKHMRANLKEHEKLESLSRE